MDLPARETAAYILERLIGEWRRYGHVFSVVRLELPADRVADAIPRLQAALRDADVLARWDDEELLVLLPETDQLGADARRRAPARRRPRDPRCSPARCSGPAAPPRACSAAPAGSRRALV